MAENGSFRFPSIESSHSDGLENGSALPSSDQENGSSSQPSLLVSSHLDGLENAKATEVHNDLCSV